MNRQSVSLSEAWKADGSIDHRMLAYALRISEIELLVSVGAINGTGVCDADMAPAVQGARMKAFLRILEQVESWAGGPQAAYKWYCSEPIASLGGKTAGKLVREGRADAVEHWLKRIGDGGYA